MHNRHPPLTTTTTGHDGSVRLELDKQGVGRRMREGIDDKAFPEQGAKVSIHSDGSFEGLGCVLANTNLNVLTAVFYWFTLKRDEPFCLLFLVRFAVLQQRMLFSMPRSW